MHCRLGSPWAAVIRFPIQRGAEPDGGAILDHASGEVGSSRSARAGYLGGERLRLHIGRNSQLALQGVRAAAILSERFAAAAGPCIGAHQRPLAEFGERIKRHQSAPGLNRRVVLAGGILLDGQPVQDIANHGQRAVPLGGEPFLKRFGIEVEIGEELTTIGVGCRLQFEPDLRAGQPLEAFEVDDHALNSTTGEVCGQVHRRARPERLA